MLNAKTNKGSFALCHISEVSSSEDDVDTLEVRMSLPHEYYANFEQQAQAFELDFSDSSSEDDSNILAKGICPRVVPKSHPISDDSNISSCPI